MASIPGSILSTFRVCYCAKARRDFELTTSDFPCGSRSEVDRKSRNSRKPPTHSVLPPAIVNIIKRKYTINKKVGLNPYV